MFQFPMKNPISITTNHLQISRIPSQLHHQWTEMLPLDTTQSLYPARARMNRVTDLIQIIALPRTSTVSPVTITTQVLPLLSITRLQWRRLRGIQSRHLAAKEHRYKPLVSLMLSQLY